MVWPGSNLGSSWTRLSPAQSAADARSKRAVMRCSLRVMAFAAAPRVAGSIRRLADAGLFHGNFWPIERAGNFEDAATAGIVRFAILVFSRVGRFDLQVGVSAEAECSVHHGHLLSAIEAEVFEQDAAIAKAQRALTRGPARNARLHGAVGNTRVDIPPAKLHLVQTKLTAAGELSQELVAAHALGFYLQSSRGHAAQALGDAARSRKLRQIHAIQFGGNLIDGAGQKLGIYFGAHFAARPFRLSFTNVELQIVERALGENVFELQFFDR